MTRAKPRSQYSFSDLAGEADGLATRSIVHWECRSADHRALLSRRGVGGLTIHENAWAYCDGAGADEGHRWESTGGVPLETLVRWAAPSAVEAPRGDGRPAAARRVAEISAKSPKKTNGARRT